MIQLFLAEVSDVEELTTLMDKFGTWVVILAFLMVLVLTLVTFMVFLMRSNNEQLREYGKTMSDQNDKFVDKMLDPEHDEQNSDFIKMYSAMMTQLKTYCKNAFAEIDSTYLSINSFHNRQYALGTGFPFIKVSTVAEWVSGAKMIAKGRNPMKDVPISMVSAVVDSLASNGEYVLRDVDEVENVEPYLKQTFKTYDTKSIVVIPIVSKGVKATKGAMIGYATAEFKHALSDEQLECARVCLKELIDDSLIILESVGISDFKNVSDKR